MESNEWDKVGEAGLDALLQRDYERELEAWEQASNELWWKISEDEQP